MFGETLFALFLAGWTPQTTPAPQTTKPVPVSANLKLRIGTSSYLSDGRVLTAATTDWPLELNRTLTIYAGNGPTMCDAKAPSTEAPAAGAQGWRIQITPTRQAAGELEVLVEWQPANGVPRALHSGNAVTLTLHPSDRVVVDYLNINDRKPFLFDFVRTKPGNTPLPTGTNTDLTHTLAYRKTFTRATPDPNGCKAIGMGLEIGLDQAKSQATVEAELWLVRKQADGTEVTQRQVMRVPQGQPASRYYFDELHLSAAGRDLLAKVSGDLSVVRIEDGRIHMNFNLSRRYEVVAPATGKLPGGNQDATTSYSDLSAVPGEVVSFELSSKELPSPRLSVRLRAQIVR